MKNAKKATETTQVVKANESATAQVEAKKVKKNKAKKEKLSKKDKVAKEVKKNTEANLVEEVISKREVKYKYPEDCTDTLSRKKFRQEVRSSLRKLELAMHRIEDKTSKDFAKARKEYEAFQSQYLKEKVAI